MKTTVKQFATGTFLAFFLFIVNVNAEGTEKRNFGHKSIETSLKLESWMTDETIWNTNSALFSDVVQETETDSNFENWMTSAEIWNSNFRFAEETDAELKAEDWMMNDAIWNSNNLNADPKLTIESWMLTDSIWN